MVDARGNVAMPALAGRVMHMRPIKTALHQAVLDERISQVRILVKKCHVNIDKKDMYGRTPLMLACLVDNDVLGTKMATLFIDAGAFLGVKDNLGRTALAYACIKGQDKIVQHILKEDIFGVNEPDNDGNTPLNHTAMVGYDEIVALLIPTLNRYSMPIDVRNCLGYTALLLAAKYGHYNIAHMLLTDGEACPTIRDNEYFRTAEGWANRSIRVQPKIVKQRPATTPAGEMTPPRPQPPLLSRDNTMSAIYLRSTNQMCKHVRPPLDQFSANVDTVRLPLISTRHFHQKTVHQSTIDVISAKQKFLRSITELEDERNLERASSASLYRPPPRKPPPSTAKLKSVAHRDSSTERNIADLRTLFRIYADQYVPPKYRPIKASVY